MCVKQSNKMSKEEDKEENDETEMVSSVWCVCVIR